MYVHNPFMRIYILYYNSYLFWYYVVCMGCIIYITIYLIQAKPQNFIDNFFLSHMIKTYKKPLYGYYTTAHTQSFYVLHKNHCQRCQKS